MNNQDYEQKKRECWEEYLNTETPQLAAWNKGHVKEAFESAFDRAYAIGKQEKDAEEAVISGWVARDEDGTLTLFYGSDKPSKKDNDDYWSAVFGNTLEYLPQEMFPALTWDSDPIEVELRIKRKDE